MLARNDIVVLVIDLIINLFLSVIGYWPRANVNGLYASTVEMILFDIDARPLTSELRLFNVAVTRSASLRQCQIEILCAHAKDPTHLLLSCSTSNRRSSSPDASASRLGGGIRG